MLVLMDLATRASCRRVFYDVIEDMRALHMVFRYSPL